MVSRISTLVPKDDFSQHLSVVEKTEYKFLVIKPTTCTDF